MKIVHLFKYYWPDNGGGIAAAMDMMIDAFKDDNDNTFENKQEIVCCWQESGKASKKDEYNGIPVYRCKSFFEFASTQFSSEFLRMVDTETCDADYVIYNFPYPFVDLAVLFGKLHGKLVVWWHCDYVTEGRKILAGVYTSLVRRTLEKASAIIVSAKGNIDGAKILGFYKDKCHIIPYAVSDEMINLGKSYYQNKQDRYEKKHILFVGRFVWYKGIDVLLNAYKRLDQEMYEMVLVGTGPLFNQMKELSTELQLKNVIFAGSVNEKEKIEWIKWSDYLVLPSISKIEAFAIVQIEAMAFGKPVINTCLDSGVPEVSIDKVTGITVSPNNVDELYHAMNKLGDRSDLLEEYGNNAIRRVEENYTMEKMKEKLHTLFDTLADK